MTGGWVMHPITVCSIVALAAIFFKLAQFRKIRLDPKAFLQDLRALLLNGKVAEAVDYCHARRGPVPAMAHAGLLKQGAPRVEIEQAMETAALYELSRLERYLGLLATIVSVAPLLGFFGTVWGMIQAFDVIYQQGLGNPALAARGISQALYTTAWGLIVAFVTLPFHNYFAAKIAEQSRNLEMTAGMLLETFAEMDRMGTKA